MQIFLASIVPPISFCCPYDQAEDHGRNRALWNLTTAEVLDEASVVVPKLQIPPHASARGPWEQTSRNSSPHAGSGLECVAPIDPKTPAVSIQPQRGDATFCLCTRISHFAFLSR